MNKEQIKKIKKVESYKVLTPMQFCGEISGDYGFEINGIKSVKGYVTRNGADSALLKVLQKIEPNNFE